MLTLTITRDSCGEYSTLGTLELTDESGRVLFNCETLEPAGAPTAEGGRNRPIPYGEYSFKWHVSPHCGGNLRPLIYGEQVSANRYILIHSGNYPSHTKGCVLVGKGRGKDAVWSSKTALDELLGHFNAAQPLENQVKLIIKEKS